MGAAQGAPLPGVDARQLQEVDTGAAGLELGGHPPGGAVAVVQGIPVGLEGLAGGPFVAGEVGDVFGRDGPLPEQGQVALRSLLGVLPQVGSGQLHGQSVAVQVGQQGVHVAEILGGPAGEGEKQLSGGVLVEDAQGHVAEPVAAESGLPRGDQDPNMGAIGEGGWLVVLPPGADVVEDQEHGLGLAAQRADCEGGALGGWELRQAEGVGDGRSPGRCQIRILGDEPVDAAGKASFLRE